MTAYYVLAIVLVAGAVVLSFFGLARPDFPPVSYTHLTLPTTPYV